MDFNSNSLENQYTLDDLKLQGIELESGTQCVFYDFDAEGEVNGFLHSAGTVWWDEKTKVFRIDMRTLRYQYTPGNDLAVLDDLYPE